MVLIFIGVAVALLTALVVAARNGAIRAERHKRDTLYAWTMTNGWQMHEGDVNTSWRQRLSGLRQFGIRRIVFSTVHGLPVTVADCHYTTESTDGEGRSTSQRVNLSVFVARLPGGWPDIEVRNRRMGSRFMRALGRQSPVEIGHAEFDRRFKVVTADPRAAHVLLSPALVDAHLRNQAPPWSLRGGELMTIEQGRLTIERIGPGVQRLGWLAEALGYRA
ncbi:hypothetical protein GCM10027176_41220 [Actinoallomurus bryophytorum]|uniref:DUF3137 domain-containing protein n=1 Tax=Actinoallomurus bryophytorum TaxID=1490222 RepID=A0A543C1F6_9ACTN|nr:hypothetical protein FB559_8234 [Actinoallomurus bryophytorum]